MSVQTRYSLDIVSDTICPWCYIGKKHFDVVPPAMVFGRICLFGDAAFVVRPHTAAATAKTAADAMALGGAFWN